MAQMTKTQTSTSTKVGVAVALLGAAALAAAGMIAIDAQKIKKQAQQPQQVDQRLDSAALTKRLDSVKPVIVKRADGLVVRGHTTVSDPATGSVKTIEFVSDIQGNVTQSTNKLQRYYQWPLRGDGHPDSSQIEEQVVMATRVLPGDMKIDDKELQKELEQGAADAAEQQTTTNVAGVTTTNTNTANTTSGTSNVNAQPIAEPKAMGSVLFVKGENKHWKNTTDPAKTLLEFDAQRPPYDKHVRKYLADSWKPNDSIWNFLVRVSGTATSFVMLNPSEWQISSESMAKADLLPFMTAVQGMAWDEHLSDVTPYTVEVVFSQKTNDLHRVYINGSDVDIHLYFAGGKTFVYPVAGWVDESILDVKNYFLDDASYGLPAELMKNYSFFHLAYDVAEVDRWFYKAPEKLVPPDRTQQDTPGDSTTNTNENPNGSSTNTNDNPGGSSTNTNTPTNGSGTNTNEEPEEPGTPEQPEEPEAPEVPETPTVTTTTDTSVGYTGTTTSTQVDSTLILK